MAPTLLQTGAVERFVCLGDKCPDTCCHGWGMQLTEQTVDKFKKEAPELMDAVSTGEAEFIMKRDPETDYCVKFDAGLCSIHRDYGDQFLGDACHFYPRITRALGSTVITTAALSCPEAARLMLCEPNGLSYSPRQELRVPFSLRNYLLDGMTEESALSIHQQIIGLMDDETVLPERCLMRVSTVARGLEKQPTASWADATALYVTLADSRIPQPQPQQADVFNLMHALHGLVQAGGRPRPKLAKLIDTMAHSLGASFSAEGGLLLDSQAPQKCLVLLNHGSAQRPIVEPILRNYLRAQLSQALFPFAGLGASLSERITIIGMRFAIIKLALAVLGRAPSAESIVDTIYILSRFLDHLADPTLTLAICKETGWLNEPRYYGLISFSQ